MTLALAIPFTFASLPVIAGTLIINNRSCLTVTDVTMDGVHQAEPIAAGTTGNFHMDNRCAHVVHGQSNVNFEWNERFACQGVPYGMFTLTWSAGNRPHLVDQLPDESLIVTANSFNGLGEAKMTSKLDCVTIEQLSANRGNCTANADLPRVLKFGQTLTVNYSCDKLLELNVSTDQGSALFSGVTD
jgi:hypothetical protein